jgi:hypothetical protein
MSRGPTRIVILGEGKAPSFTDNLLYLLLEQPPA